MRADLGASIRFQKLRDLESSRMKTAMSSCAVLVARTVLEQFEKLPSKRKPISRGSGLEEWIPLSGIVAERDGTFSCLALATGMKCLPAAKLPDSNGVGLHDWHAEVLAIRMLNRFFLDECRTLLHDSDVSDLLIRQAPGARPPFRVKPGIKLHMYCSEAPCGDASMELVMANQEDASPWEAPSGPEADALPGRAFFSQLGLVRRKPARGDAPPTLSKSCSDKIALKQCTSLLSSLTSLFIDPCGAYIDTLVLPESQYSLVACSRSFSAQGRMKPLVGKRWEDGYAFHPFSIETTNDDFRYSKRSVQSRSEAISPSNIAAAWSRSGNDETITGGVIQGRKPFDVRGASSASRRHMWMSARELAEQLHDFPEILRHLEVSTYQHVKNGPLLAGRRLVKAEARKEALAGWVQNRGDSSFGL